MKRSPLRRTGRLKPVSAKKAKEHRESRSVVAEVFERDGGCVLRSRTDEWGPCFGDLTPHHLRKASAGGSYTLNQLIALCECHNGAVEDWPAAAKAWGLVVNHAITSIEAYRRRELHGIGPGSRPEEDSL